MATLNEEAKRLWSGSSKFFRCLTSENSKEDTGVDQYASQKRTWSMSKVGMLFLLQLLSALTCVGLSLYRLVRQQYYNGNSGSDTKNLKPALKVFYGLSLAESFLILLEKAYWLWKIIAGKLLTEVNREHGFNDPELAIVRRFLYDTYSRCVHGSIFDGLKMQFVSHSVELLLSCSGDGQLMGARVLSALASNEKFAEKTLRTIGTMREVVERLIDMLNFKNDHEEEIRKAAAQIISKLVENKRNCIRVTAFTGFVESIASLLYSNDSNPGGFVSLGLTILKKLAEERSNHHKLNSTRGLLPKIISLTDLKPSALQFEPNALQLQIERDAENPFAIETSELALQIVKTLASTTGSTGKDLRKRIRQIVFAISNLRNVLHYTEINLRILAIETLTSLAREQEGRESIGGTGGVLGILFSFFFIETINNKDEKEKLVKTAGEALGFLSLETNHNCNIMMNIRLDGHPNLIASLISVLNDTVKGIHAARILRNLLTYAEEDAIKVREITALQAQVMKFVKEEHSCNHEKVAISLREKHSCDYEEAAMRCEKQEAAIGLAARFFTKWNFDPTIKELSGVTEKLLVKLVEVFHTHPYPLKMVPNVRRFSIEVLIAVMERDKGALEKRSELVGALEEALQGVMETTSDWENYSFCSGSKGLSRHSTPIRSLAQSALELLRN
eukprot:PITA_06950